MTDAIAVAGVCKRYAGRPVLDQVGFAVPQGSIFGLLGPNGAGKTTLFSIIAGFVRADAGSVRVLGHDHRAAAVLRGRLGVLPQDAAFQSDLSILDQLVYFLRLAGRTPARARREVGEALDRVGLADWLGRRSTELSHGMAKRLALTQAFLGDPEVVLLDEPTAGLDPANAERIRAVIREQAARRAAVVVSSHDLAEMQALCSHVAILRQGRLASCAPLAEMVAAGVRARLLPAGDPALACAALAAAGIPARRGEDGWIDLDLGGDPVAAALAAQRALLAAGVLIRRWEDGGSLAEHFRSVTR